MQDSRLTDAPSAAILSRSIYLEKSASMQLLEINGQNARKFLVPEATMRKILLSEQHQHQQQQAGTLLRRVHLHRVLLAAGSSNDFPFSLGVRVHGIPCTVFDEQGQDWTCILPPRHALAADCVVFESAGDERLMQTWEEEFPKWNADNLETVCAMKVPDSDIIMVHVEHPVVQLLEKKFEEFGTVPPAQLPMTTPNWRNLGAEVFAQCCRWLRENILNKSTKTFNLTTLTVSFGKVDQGKFTDLPPSCFEHMPLTGAETAAEINELKTRFGNLLVQRVFGVRLRLVLEYRLAQADG